MKDDKPNIELGSDEPEIEKIVEEIQLGQTDAAWFHQRMQQAREWWAARWPGQSIDGRKWRVVNGQAVRDEEDCFPWEGAADARIRTVATLVRDHVMVSKYAYFKAKFQAQSIRPLVQSGESNKATKLLQWRLNNHMCAEQVREIPQAFNWWHGYGIGLLTVGWEQSRRLEYVDINLNDLDQIIQGQGGEDPDNWLWLLDAILDPAQEDALTTLVQELSPIVSRPEARKIVRDLRTVRNAKLPVATPFQNKPYLCALKPVVDALWPSETCDLQQGRWFLDMHEWLSETELRDRIETENYDPEFVDQAIKTAKGQSPSPSLLDQGIFHSGTTPGSKRDLIQIYKFHYKATMEGTPILLTTEFNPLVKDKKGKNLWAKHGPGPYDHGFYPAVCWARRTEGRRLLDAVGIVEEAYTDEQDIKRQQDGLSDRTSIVHRPPMIVPQNKVAAVKGSYRPGAILGVGRAKVDWGPLPPIDSTPVQVMEAVMMRLENRYPLFGNDLDPAKKQLYREEVSGDTLAVAVQAIDMIFQLMQQYELDEEVAEVVGPLQRPFHVSKAEIQGKHEIRATIDIRMLDEDYAEKKFGLIAQALMFKQEGLLFDMALEAIDPDAADAVKASEVSPAAMEKEKADELDAVSRAFNGIESPLPMFGNHQLRLQTLLQATLQSQNPAMRARLMANPDTQQILMNRAQFFMNQIQQYQQNPGIGRALQTRTFARKQAPQLMTGQPPTGGGGEY